VIFGVIERPALKTIADVTPREIVTFAPLVAGTLILGIYPSFATDIFGPAVAALVEGVAQDVAAWRDIALAQN
jgi:NADH-quinone oxidoreductase subunit M